MTAAPLSLGVAAIAQSRRSSPSLRRHWVLVGVAALLWSAATVLSAREALVLMLPSNVVAGSQVLYFLYGVPLLLGICSPLENVWARSFIWLDGFQITLLVLLTYVTVFGHVAAPPANRPHLTG